MGSVPERFVETYVRGRKCSVCDGMRWYLANEGKPLSFLSFGAAESPRVDVVGVCCGDCGYMRFHAVDIVNDTAA